MGTSRHGGRLPHPSAPCSVGSASTGGQRFNWDQETRKGSTDFIMGVESGPQGVPETAGLRRRSSLTQGRWSGGGIHFRKRNPQGGLAPANLGWVRPGVPASDPGTTRIEPQGPRPSAWNASICSDTLYWSPSSAVIRAPTPPPPATMAGEGPCPTPSTRRR